MTVKPSSDPEHPCEATRTARGLTGLMTMQWTIAFVLAAIGLGCGSGSKPACIEGQSIACACPSGGYGAQSCKSDNTFGTCTCERSASTTTPQQSSNSKCSLDALNCASFSTNGRTGLKLHELVFAARSTKRYAEAICLAQKSVSSPDGFLAGASYFETAKSWEALGCTAEAITAVAKSLQVRPYGRSGWKETCDLCKELGAPCFSDCSGSAVAACPPPAKSSSLISSALETPLKVTLLECIGGRFPAPGWAFAAWVGEVEDAGGAPGDGKGARLHHLILSEAGDLVADMSAEIDWHERNGNQTSTIHRFEVADFDGDGSHEIAEETEYMRRGWIIGKLVVYRREGATLMEALTTQTSFNDSGMMPEKGITDCKAAWRASDDNRGGKTLVITGKQGNSSATECVKGTERYALRGRSFVKL